MMFLRRLVTLCFPGFPGSAQADCPSAADAVAAAFRAWAGVRGHRVVAASAPTGFRVLGRIAGRDVVVDPGLDRGVPGWVQVTVSVALPNTKPLLVTRATRPNDAAAARVRDLFDDPDLGPELRAISLSAHHLRLRLAPGASPALVEGAVDRVGATMRALFDAPQPRHSCITTVPYPT